MKKNRPLVILTGPTSVGKTKLSIALSKSISGEIISADSMQIYKHMDIGSAKIKKEDMQGVPHHLIDILEPTESFNVVSFAQLCNEKIEEIYQRKHMPIIVGGTGFYIQSVLYGIDFTLTSSDTTYRTELENMLKYNGPHFLHEMLKEVDPLSASLIHENNTKRVIRALEFYKETGVPISEHNTKEHNKESVFNACYFVLNDEREVLYNRINNRVDEMLSEGLIKEVEYLKSIGCTQDMVSMQGLGYKEILSYLNGDITLDEAIYQIKRDTRHFAKRQLTWFRREKDVIWIDKKELGYDDTLILDTILSNLQEKSIVPLSIS